MQIKKRIQHLLKYIKINYSLKMNNFKQKKISKNYLKEKTLTISQMKMIYIRVKLINKIHKNKIKV